MCGIVGYIGKSKYPDVSYELITALFQFLQVRGTDASGIWGLCGEQTLYEKQPVRSSTFCMSDYWNDLKHIEPNLLLCHCRAASKGAMHAIDNCNNHPFVSENRKIGLIHNGFIEESKHLADRYQIESDTDSEFLLRIYENAPESLRHFRMSSIKEMLSFISTGNSAFSIAIGERTDSGAALFLFHNKKRPLWIADLREQLGQILFVSTPAIWRMAAQIVGISSDLIEVPTEEVWLIKDEGGLQEPLRYTVKVGKSKVYRSNSKLDIRK